MTTTPELELSTTAEAATDAVKVPYLQEVEEYFRQLVIAEKNFHLYPVQGTVVQQSLDSVHAALDAATSAAGLIRLQLAQNEITYQDQPVYEEEHKGKSVAFRMYKDRIRDLVLLDEEDDFITLFWEKDCSSIQVRLADDFLSSEDVPEMPESISAMQDVDLERFDIPESERARLDEILEERKAGSEDDGGESTFELTDEERDSIRELVENEDRYFPVFDFLDILIELMVRKSDTESFDKAVKMIRTVLDSLIQERDFQHAAQLMTKFSSSAHPALTDSQRRALKDMVASFRDKKTLEIVESFLQENPKLAADHPVFEFMKAYPKNGAEEFCQFLTMPSHVKAVSEVLVHLGTGRVEQFTKHLADPDPLVVRALIGVLVRADGNASAAKIARALAHPDENVRIHAAKTILENGDSSAGTFFLPLLGESSRQLLNLALQFFIKNPVPEAFDALADLVQSKRFQQLDQKRQILTFRAILQASSHKGLDFVEKKVLGRVFSFGQHAKAKKSAALSALGYSDSDQALAILARFATRKGFLAGVAQKTMKDAGARQQAAARGGQKTGTTSPRPRTGGPEARPPRSRPLPRTQQQSNEEVTHA